MKNLNLVFFGNTKYSVIGAEIINQKYSISLLVTIPDKLVGREKTLTQSPPKAWALKENIPILEAEKLTEEKIQKISEIEPDFLIVEDYGLILPKELLEIPKVAPINVHHSLLPKYRGPSPAPTAILNGEKVSGVTIIKMGEEVDSGDILAQKEYELAEDETTDSLLTKLNQIGGKLALEVIEQYLDDTIRPVPQDSTKVIFTKYIKKQDGYFEINNPPDPEKLDRMIRAYFPWPNVWTKWQGKIVKFLPSPRHPEHPLSSSSPGSTEDPRFHRDSTGGSTNMDSLPVRQAGGSQAVRNDSKYLIQMEGKKTIPLKDFLNGYPNFPIKNMLK